MTWLLLKFLLKRRSLDSYLKTYWQLTALDKLWRSKILNKKFSRIIWNTNLLIRLTLIPGAHCAENYGWGGFSTFQRWRSRVFFRSDLTDPQSDFWCASFGKYRFKPFQILFYSGFYIKIIFLVRWFYSLFEGMRSKRKRTMFIHTNQPLITSFYIKKVPIVRRVSH